MESHGAADAVQVEGNVSGLNLRSGANPHRSRDSDVERCLVCIAVDPPVRRVEPIRFVANRRDRIGCVRCARDAERYEDGAGRGNCGSQCGAGRDDGAGDVRGSTKREAACSWTRTFVYVFPACGGDGRFVRTTFEPPVWFTPETVTRAVFGTTSNRMDRICTSASSERSPSAGTAAVAARGAAVAAGLAAALGAHDDIPNVASTTAPIRCTFTILSSLGNG